MKILLLSGGLVLGSFGAFGQTVAKQRTEQHSAVSFDQFCHEHALTLIDATEKKMSTEGTVPNANSKDYKDYGVQPLEDRAQYFQIENTGRILKVESLYRLRLAYEQK